MKMSNYWAGPPSPTLSLSSIQAPAKTEVVFKWFHPLMEPCSTYYSDRNRRSDWNSGGIHAECTAWPVGTISIKVCSGLNVWLIKPECCISTQGHLSPRFPYWTKMPMTLQVIEWCTMNKNPWLIHRSDRICHRTMNNEQQTSHNKQHMKNNKQWTTNSEQQRMERGRNLGFSWMSIVWIPTVKNVTKVQRDFF